MPRQLKKWALTFVKVAIAVLGLWIVIWAPWKDEPNLVWRDRATLKADTEIRGLKLLDPVPVWLIEKPREAPAAPGNIAVAIVTFSDRPVRVLVDGREQSWPLSGPELRRALAPVGWTGTIEPDTGPSLTRWLKSFRTPEPQLLIPESLLTQTQPKAGETPAVVKQVGLRRLVREANPWLLLAAWSLLVIPFLVSAWRWRELMRPQGIRLPFSKCLALTFVGQFYSTFLPGITGGDLVKIVYTARVIGSKTKATVTVLLDRVIGLIALMVIGGSAAALQSGSNPTMRNVALLIGAILAGLITAAIVYFSHRLRRLSGLDWLLNHRSMPEFIRKADDVLHVYRGHTGVLFEAFAISLITQIVVPLSAWLAGLAFGIPLHPGYYLAYVPMTILVASLPISPPQGLGLMDSLILHFFVNRGSATAGQAFALAQSIRFLPILWNLVGAYWVVTGSYSRHQAMTESARQDSAEHPATPQP